MEQTNQTVVKHTIDEKEKQLLIFNKHKRTITINFYKDFIQSMLVSKKKGSEFRKSLRLFLLKGADTLFEEEELEYKYINKFGRGHWCYDHIEQSFNKDEINTLVQLARGYGAFDY